MRPTSMTSGVITPTAGAVNSNLPSNFTSEESRAELNNGNLSPLTQAVSDQSSLLSDRTIALPDLRDFFDQSGDLLSLFDQCDSMLSLPNQTDQAQHLRDSLSQESFDKYDMFRSELLISDNRMPPYAQPSTSQEKKSIDPGSNETSSFSDANEDEASKTESLSKEIATVGNKKRLKKNSAASNAEEPTTYVCKVLISDGVFQICGLKFSEKGDLEKHDKSHIGSKSYGCESCDLAFISSAFLLKHMSSHNSCECEICGKTFSKKCNIGRHMRTHHTDDRPYLCEICGKVFKRSDHIKQHMSTHTGEKLYVCNVCSRGFAQKCHYSVHMRIHTEEKPYACGDCGKRFVQKGNCVVHMRSHTGEKPYVCSDCGKGFSQGNDRTIHMRTHTGEKPYVCNICNRGFGRVATLNKHKKRHVNNKTS